jgi:hypothetical protein
MRIRLKQKRQLIIHFPQEEVMVELELKSSSSHLGCKTLCYIGPMVKRFKMFKGKVFFRILMKHFHKVEFLNIVCDEFPSHRLVLLIYVWMVLWSMWFWYSVLSLDLNTSTKDWNIQVQGHTYYQGLPWSTCNALSWNGPKTLRDK